MIVTSVQIKTAKTQKHLYCLVFTKVHRNFDRITADFLCYIEFDKVRVYGGDKNEMRACSRWIYQ